MSVRSSTRYDSKTNNASPLGEPLHFAFANRTAPNRFLKGAMTERLSSWSPTDLPARGVPSPELINTYRRWGEGAIGVILTGNVMIAYDHLEAAGNPIIPPDAPFSGPRFDAFTALATASKAHGCLVVAQVSHPGRQCERRIQAAPVSASDIQLEGTIMGLNFAKPHAATLPEISAIVAGFAHAAQYLEKAGFDGIELHGAHGYLLAQFLAQSTNKRTDAYGGSLANRARIITEIAAACRKVTSPSFIMSIKINSAEFQKDGFQPEDARELCEILERERFDFVELSGGTYEELAFMHKRDSTKAREAFFVEFAESIVPALKQTRAYVTGGFKTVGAMVDALDTVDGCGLARPLAQEPDLCKRILDGEVTGAIRQRFDDADFGLTNVVAGSQMRQLGRDYQPLDGSDEGQVESFKRDMGVWMKALKEDGEKMEKFGYCDTNFTKNVPYGSHL